MREADKILVNENENTNTRFVDRVAQYVARNGVQCSLNGLFRRVQCSLELKLVILFKIFYINKIFKKKIFIKIIFFLTDICNK